MASSWIGGASIGMTMLTVASVASAQTTRNEATSPTVVVELMACRSIGSEMERLACFDRAAAAFEAARQQREIAVVDSREVREARRSLFGLPVPKLKLLSEGQNAEEAESITGTIRSVQVGRGGKWIVQVDDAVWQTTDSAYFQVLPKVGQEATVTRGVMGSFRLSVAGRSGLKAVRVR